MNIIRLFGPGVFLILLSCSPRVVNFVNPSINFSNYSTYAIVNFKGNNAELSAEGEKILSIIESKIDHEMSRRAYSYALKPDLMVRYELVSGGTNNRNNNNNFNSLNPLYYPNLNNYSNTTVKQSALLIEIFDTETRKLLWQASVDMDSYQKKSKKEEVLSDAISNLFDTYLYRANSNSTDQSLISNSK